MVDLFPLLSNFFFGGGQGLILINPLDEVFDIPYFPEQF